MTLGNTSARLRALALTAAVGSTLLLSGTATAAPRTKAAPDLVCAQDVMIVGVDPNGGLWHNLHADPENGTADWTSRGKLIGQHWYGRTITGADGRVYAVLADGEIHRWRYNGTGWDAPPPGQTYDVIATGDWIKKFVTPEYRNRLTFDANGDLYTIEPSGELIRHRFEESTRRWAPARVLAAGWDRYDAIFASGDGVIYARDKQGQLFRHQYNAASQRWLQESGVALGGGWGQFTRLFSPGGDVIYGMTANGELKWHRVVDGKLTAGSGRVLVSGWTAEADIAATTDGCRLNSDFAPPRPSVPWKANSRTQLTVTADSRIHHTFVGHDREVYDAVQTRPDNLELEFKLAPGHRGASGTPTVAPSANGELNLLSLNTSSDVYAGRLAGEWTGAEEFGGRMASAPTLVRNELNQLSAFAFDGDGLLWQRTQVRPDGPFGPWRKLAPHPGTTFTADAPAVLRSQRDSRLVALDRTGVLQYVDIAPENVPNTGTYWQPLPSDVKFTGRASIIEQPGGGQSVVARGADGQVRVITGTSSWGGFRDATWKIVGPGRTFVGEPQATTSPNGVPAIGARDGSGNLYFAEQLSDGSFTEWELMNNGAPSATELSMVRYGPDTVVLSFRDADDQLYVGSLEWRAQAPGGTKAAAPKKVTFTKVKKNR
ncbi:tachylectin-related carbohydrate-binding protein [Allokutzneria oryzae]|uniref:Tachylectin-related carbohydrate-binding protein n=1 Tax=Allokutzneria oryzae TaxID=1378989 RepID=A0ABV5ZYZ2_9PSEU